MQHSAQYVYYTPNGLIFVINGSLDFGLASSTLGSSVLSFMVNGERMSEIVVLILVLHEKLPQTARNALRLNAQ